MPNRNKAASYARGKYLKYLDSDDKIYDFGLAYCVGEMEKAPEAALGLIVNYDMGIAGSECWPSEKIIREHFFTRHYLMIGPTGSIYRRDRFEGFNGFDTRFGVASDSYFNIRMACAAPVVLLQKPYFYYREHDGQERNNHKGYIKNGYLYFKELMQLGELPLEKKEIDFLYRKLEKRHAMNLTKFLVDTRDWGAFRQLMKETKFSFPNMLTGYFK